MALVTIRVRRGTAAEWTAANPVLGVGEPGLETDTLKIKYGNGSTAWNSLAYAAGGSGAVSSVNTKTGAVTLTASDVGAVDTATFVEQLQDQMATTLVGGSGMTVSYNDTSGQITLTPAVTTVAGRTGNVTLGASDVGLGSVNNTADSAKPVSTAQQAALDLKLNNTVAGQASVNVVVVAHGAATPAGLPNGTAVIELL